MAKLTRGRTSGVGADVGLSLKVNKTEASDAHELAQIIRVGWYREAGVKGIDRQAVRALLVVRAKLGSQVIGIKNCVRGALKTFGRVLPNGLRSRFRVWAAIAVHDLRC